MSLRFGGFHADRFQVPIDIRPFQVRQFRWTSQTTKASERDGTAGICENPYRELFHGLNIQLCKIERTAASADPIHPISTEALEKSYPLRDERHWRIEFALRADKHETRLVDDKESIQIGIFGLGVFRIRRLNQRS